MISRPKVTMSDYRDEVLALVPSALPHETVQLAQAAGRILRSEATAKSPVPGFDNSAMDGIAMRWADLESRGVPCILDSVGDIPAGSNSELTVTPGTYARIMTGAPVPDGADAVVPVEQIRQVSPSQVAIDQMPSKGQGAHIRRCGEDVGVGDSVVEAGTRLDAAHLAALSAIGIHEVQVSRPARVAVVATGDELITPPTPLNRGQIYESNAVYLSHWLTALGVNVVRTAHVPDDPKQFNATLDELSEVADLIVLTGGVSVGDFDVVRDGLIADGHAEFRFVTMQPGKPQGFARWRGKTPTVGFPGNPISTVVSAQLFLRPLIEKLTGETPQRPISCVAAHGWRTPAGRDQFMPVVASVGDDLRFTVGRTHHLGSASHAVTAAAGATGLVHVPADVQQVEAGDTLTYWSLTPGVSVLPS